jgi:hypothetical protein
VTDFEARIKAAELQKQLSNIEAAKKWYTMAALLDGEKAQVVYESLHLLYEPLPMFVQFPLPEKSEAETGAADGKSEEPAPKTDAADAEVNSEKTRQLDDDAVEKKEEAAVDSKPEVKEEADTSTAEPAAAAESPKNEE